MRCFLKVKRCLLLIEALVQFRCGGNDAFYADTQMLLTHLYVASIRLHVSASSNHAVDNL